MSHYPGKNVGLQELPAIERKHSCSGVLNMHLMAKRIRGYYSKLRLKAPPGLLYRTAAIEERLRDHFIDEFKEGAFRSYEMNGKVLRIQRIDHKDIIHIDFLGHEMIFEGTSFFNEGFIPIDGYLKYYIPKPGDVIVDGGAFVGFFTVLASKLVGPTGKVLSFEPDPINYEKLLRNIQLNGISNVIPVKAALLDKESTSLLNASGGEESALEKYTSRKEHLVEVKVVCLSDEIRRQGIGRVNFIKLDIEGSEGPCLLGSSEILKMNDVNLAIASYHEVDGQRSCTQVEQILRSMGYQSWTEHPPHLTTYGRHDSSSQK